MRLPRNGAIIPNTMSMLILPAIDILNGRCVRLYKGDYDRSKIYFENPVEVARSFKAAGARWLHIVDLDAARGQGENNRKVIGGIRRAVSCSLEVGGGIRSGEDVKELVELGVDRLIVGTVLARNPELVSGWCAQYPGRLAAGIDALGGMVRVSGWESDSGVEDIDLAAKAAAMG
ncbi:MAG: 1-(5-phosphoribosyl)-5-((5-phosphoribosylamino)methylideneamino)imidazole-4-carboxamide isomerase, partial [Spirochaeta sp.]|nr:1-(5-phosphoribosyl)-5-((5-phosphoribosylamino)methylideneamino)imidazole-4-carboxamide isomerase [Spirochaeta sp.]